MFVWFSDRPFTTELAIQGHEKAFGYIGGIPSEIVYDQDTVFISNENSGDIILTGRFRDYVREQRFGLHFCRKSDPESKGKIENAVGYVKRNFLYNRTFQDLQILNLQAIKWLERTTNAMQHGVTRQVPQDELVIERPFLARLIHCPRPTPPRSFIRLEKTIPYPGKAIFIRSHWAPTKAAGPRWVSKKKGIDSSSPGATTIYYAPIHLAWSGVKKWWIEATNVTGMWDWRL